MGLLSGSAEEPMEEQMFGLQQIGMAPLTRFALPFMLIVSVSCSSLLARLQSHEWCHPCRLAESIFTSLAPRYPSISFTTQTHAGELSPQRLLPYPYIQLRCHHQSIPYQHDLTLLQVQYWLNIICLKRIPTCPKNIRSLTIKLHSAVQHNHQEMELLLQQIILHPHIRVCSTPDSTSVNSTSKATLLLRSLGNELLYFDYFSHNIRKYLISTGKLVIAHFHKRANPDSPFARLYSLATPEQASGPNQNLLGFQLTKEEKQQLMFLSLCFNSDKSKCKSKQSTRIIATLLEFIDEPTLFGSEADDEEWIVAFRFKGDRLLRYIYQGREFDEKLLYWASLLLRVREGGEWEMRECEYNSLVHRYSWQLMRDMQINVRMVRFMRGVPEIPFRSERKRYVEGWAFRLCLEGQTETLYDDGQSYTLIQARIQLAQAKNPSQQL